MTEIVAAHLERVAKARELVKAWLWDDVGTPFEQHERVIENIAAALAACAREARMNVHANTLHDYHASHGTLDLEKYHRAALERAVGEKAPLDPQGGQHES